MKRVYAFLSNIHNLSLCSKINSSGNLLKSSPLLLPKTKLQFTAQRSKPLIVASVRQCFASVRSLAGEVSEMRWVKGDDEDRAVEERFSVLL